MVSTPNGLNMFYHYWRGATKKNGEVGKNEYVPIEVHWSQVPKFPGGPCRDEKWKQETISNTSEQQFQSEFECLGGSTMINIRDKETKEEFEILLKDAFDFLH